MARMPTLANKHASHANDDDDDHPVAVRPRGLRGRRASGFPRTHRAGGKPTARLWTVPAETLSAALASPATTTPPSASTSAAQLRRRRGPVPARPGPGG